MTETRIITRSIIEDYKNSKHQLTTELVNVYQCPTDIKASIIILCHAANIDNLNDGSVTIGWSDFSDDEFITYLIYNGNLPARSGLNILHGKLFLEPLDSIWASADALNRVHLTLSVLEIS
jgi:hypothetical protein